MSATIVLGVGAGIAAYKAAHLLRLLVTRGHHVHVVPTPASLSFVGEATWAALSGNPVHTGVFDAPVDGHVELARSADLVLVVPTTADLIARIRAGIADDLLTTTLLASTCPVVLAPAMHTAMWSNAATQDNVDVLRRRGIHVIEPAVGDLSSGDYGKGRLPEIEDIAREALTLLSAGQQVQDLHGCRIVVTAGGTREPLDPVRFIGNISSGKQGCEIARAARERGADVTLIASNISSELLPTGVHIVNAPRAVDVDQAVSEFQARADVLIMCAAVADFRPRDVSHVKIKKNLNGEDAPTLVLERTVDVLRRVASSDQRPPFLIGFAAETGDLDTVLALGMQKARTKGADLLVVNRVGDGHGFGDVANEVHFLSPTGEVLGRTQGSKRVVADALLDRVALWLGTIDR